jgi:hypothetical protein
MKSKLNGSTTPAAHVASPEPMAGFQPLSPEIRCRQVAAPRLAPASFTATRNSLPLADLRKPGPYAWLTLLSTLALAYRLWNQFAAAGETQDFLQFVRQLLA